MELSEQPTLDTAALDECFMVHAAKNIDQPRQQPRQKPRFKINMLLDFIQDIPDEVTVAQLRQLIKDNAT